MNNNEGTFGCTVWCAVIALAGGVFATALLLLLTDWILIQAVFIGIIVVAVAAPLLIWLLCRPLPAIGETSVTTAEAPAPKAQEAPATAAQPAAAPAAAAAETPAAEIKPSTVLPGEQELAERKGEWRYEGGDAPAADPAPAAAPEPAPAPEPAADPGDGKKPETLAAARDGGPDNLKEIKGVGPKLEALLNSMGFYHFDQVASWGADEVAWVDQNLQGFKGRVSRDDWVAQAKILAAGGETEFSKKVDKGGVYD